MVLWFALLLAAAWVTYRVIQAPFQQMGRRVTKTVEARFGSDRNASLSRSDRATQHEAAARPAPG